MVILNLAYASNKIAHAVTSTSIGKVSNLFTICNVEEQQALLDEDVCLVLQC